MRRRRDRGGVLLVLILVLLIAAAVAGALAVRGATSDLRMSGAQRVARSSFYCAEGGLNAARPIFLNNYAAWSTILATGTTAAFTYPLLVDVDGQPGSDVQITMIDNFDEPAGTPNNPAADNDLTVILVAQCISTTMTDANTQRVLEQVITYTGTGGFDYRYQAGHSSTHSGNEN